MYMCVYIDILQLIHISVCVYIYIYIYIYVGGCIYIYIYRERERYPATAIRRGSPNVTIRVMTLIWL